MKYLTKHLTEAAYEAAASNLAKPHVALTADDNNVHYMPNTTPPTPTAETRVVAIFNVKDTSDPTPILYDTSNIASIEIDGTELPSVVDEYEFSTVGEHTVKYTLADPTTIGEYAFYGCYTLASIDIPDSVTIIGDRAFDECHGLTTCTIGSGVTSIGEYAFSSCSSLMNIDISDSVTSIGNYAFYDCGSLSTCIIGSGVTSIGEFAFYDCGSLTSITVESTTPPTLGTSAFNEDNHCPIYVPSASVGTYKEAEGWSEYTEYIQAIS